LEIPHLPLYALLHDALAFIRSLDHRKLWNYLLLKGSYYYSRIHGKAVHRGMPFSLSVEPANFCNLRCPECPAGQHSLERPAGYMDIGAFQGMIKQLKKHLSYLMLYFQGEPMLNPGIYDMIAGARKERIYTMLSTNGHHLDDDQAEKLVRSGLSRLIISMDGSRQETYEKYRVGGDLEKVKSGIRNVAGWKKKLGTRKPYVIVQFLVLKSNVDEIYEAKSLAKSLGADRFELKTVQVYNYRSDDQWIPVEHSYSRYVRGADGKWDLSKPIRNRCFRMWSGAVVTWDGRVVPCCFDKDAGHQLGDIGERSFHDIWKGKAYSVFRDQVFKDRSKIDICNNCTE
jgi:radical SAM protein with 4Fe4S-binding SPASM domain